MHALEYLVAGLIMIIFISFSSAVIMPSVYIPLTHIKEQQLDVLAERITDKILLTPGIPYDWQIVETEPSEIELYPDEYNVLGDNNDASYITISIDNSPIQLNISDPDSGNIGITDVKVYVRLKGAGVNTMVNIRVNVGSKEIDKFLNIKLGNDWENKSLTLSKKSWTWDEIRDLNIVLERKNDDVYCSELWVVIQCEPTPEGLHPKELNGFGLALYEENVKSLAEPYVLDRDKVLRLTSESVQLDPLDVARSLGLMEDNHLKYGFHIKIKPALNISRTVTYNTTEYSKKLYKTIHVKVINYENKPLANARVYGLAILFYIDTDQKTVGLDWIINQTTTDVLGEADITYDYASDKNIEDIISRKPTGTFDYTFLYITYVDFYGLKSYAIDSLSDVETPAMIVPTEDGITVLHDPSEFPRGAIHMRGVFGVSLPYIMSEGEVKPNIYKVWVRTRGAESYNIINHGGKEYVYYSLTGVEQELNAVGICFKWTGEFHFYIVSLRKIIGEELNYGILSGIGGKKTIVVAKRIVRIEGMDYVFEFKMWRMAED